VGRRSHPPDAGAMKAKDHRGIYLPYVGDLRHVSDTGRLCPPSQAGPCNPPPAPTRERKGPVDLRHQRDLYSGFGDALARAFEFVATPALFAFLGWLLDRWLGT